jgi:hypothetical protein
MIEVAVLLIVILITGAVAILMLNPPTHEPPAWEPPASWGENITAKRHSA